MRRLFAGLFAVLGAASCGGGGGATPGRPDGLPTPAPGLPAGTALGFVSGADGAPVAGATVTVAGQGYATDAAGRVVLAGPVAAGASLDVVSAEFLDRQTVVQSDDRLFALWPRRTASGVNEQYTATLVYTNASRDDSPLGEVPLQRLATGARAVMFLAPDIAADPVAHARHAEAAARVNAMLGGPASFAVAVERPASGLVFDVRISPDDPWCRDARLAFAARRVRSDEISGGRIIYCVPEHARNAATVVHEMGHAAGFEHSPLREDVMYPFLVRGGPEDFGARESLTMRLMMQRRPGNRHPDRDVFRAAGGRGAETERVVFCPR